MDSNGRIKLSADFLRDFQARGVGPVILHCLMPEGALALFPQQVWEEMRRSELAMLERVANSVAYRRALRRFGAFSTGVEISNQGRVTVPPRFREHAGILAAGEVLLVGSEVGVEIWSPERFYQESSVIQQAQEARGQREMANQLKEGQNHGQDDAT